MVKKFCLGLMVVIFFGGCAKDEVCNYDECAVKAPPSEIQSVRDYLGSQGISNAAEHCSGLLYVVDDPGTGKRPNNCSAVSVTYKGTLTNGNTFDQRTAGFELDGVITGWTNGIPLIKEGGKIRLYIPPSLGYGNRQNGSIPANSILIFEVTLHSVQ